MTKIRDYVNAIKEVNAQYKKEQDKEESRLVAKRILFDNPQGNVTATCKKGEQGNKYNISVYISEKNTEHIANKDVSISKLVCSLEDIDNPMDIDGFNQKITFITRSGLHEKEHKQEVFSKNNMFFKTSQDGISTIGLSAEQMEKVEIMKECYDLAKNEAFSMYTNSFDSDSESSMDL